MLFVVKMDDIGDAPDVTKSVTGTVLVWTNGSRYPGYDFKS